MYIRKKQTFICYIQNYIMLIKKEIHTINTKVYINYFVNTKQIIIKYSTKEGYCPNITSNLKSLKVHLKQKSTQLNCSYLKILNTWPATKPRQFSICAIIVQNKMRAMWSFSVTRRSTLTSYG